ncbi:MAG: hypothetical protein L0G46_05860 [Kocuria sp.]|nr:hypothetical protein [Kocuria sp.]
MTTMIRTQSKISNDLAEYLLPDLGVPVAARWVASIMNPEDPNRIPEAMGLSRTAAVRTTPADVRVIDSADGKALQITKGSYQLGAVCLSALADRGIHDDRRLLMPRPDGTHRGLRTVPVTEDRDLLSAT